MANVFVVDTFSQSRPSEESLTFSATMRQMESLTQRVEELSRQAETYFWQTRYNDLAINSLSYERTWLNMLSDVTGIQNAVAGAQKLCWAAYPMLDEILNRLWYVCGIAADYETLGSASTDTVWAEESGPTQTFYQSTVSTACSGLRSLFQQLDAWSKSTREFESIVAIQEQYAGVLETVYERGRALVNQLGPLWAPVICNYTPYVLDTVETRNNAELFFPDTCTVETLDTHRLEVAFWYKNELLPVSELLRIASGNADMDAGEWATELLTWCAAKTQVAGAMNVVYRSQGGLCYLETMMGTNAPSTGVYEILDIGDTLILNNERVDLVASVSNESTSYTNTTFQLRFLRKRKELEDVVDPPQTYVNVQYRADVCDADEDPPTKYMTLDEDQLEQNFSMVFSSSFARHVAPSLTKTSIFPSGKQIIWRQYDKTSVYLKKIYMGDVPVINGDTLMIADIVDAQGIHGSVSSIALSNDGNYVYVGGSFLSVGEDSNYSRLCKFSVADGTIDTVFNPEINGPVDFIVVSGTDLYFGGNFTEVDGVSGFTGLARYQNEVLDESFKPQIDHMGIPYWLEKMVISGTNLYILGTFIMIDGTYGFSGLAKFEDGVLNTTFRPYFNLETGMDISVAGSNLYLTLTGEINGVSGYGGLVKFESDVLNTTFQPQINYHPYSISAIGTSLYLCGMFTEIDNTNGFSGLAKFESDTLNVTFKPQVSLTGNLPIRFVFAFGTDLYIAGSFSEIGYASGFLGLAKFESDVLNLLYQPRFNVANVLSVIPSSTDLYAVGSFFEVNGEVTGSGVKLDEDGILVHCLRNPAP